MPVSLDVLASDDSVGASSIAFGFALVALGEFATFVALAVLAFFAELLAELLFLAVLHFALSLHLRLFCSAAIR